MIKRDIIKSNEPQSLKWREKKDFDIMINCIVTVATLKKVNIKAMTSDGVINFAKKYANEINEEYKRMEDMKKANPHKKEEKKKYW